jgi:hypothetical protein
MGDAILVFVDNSGSSAAIVFGPGKFSAVRDPKGVWRSPAPDAKFFDVLAAGYRLASDDVTKALSNEARTAASDYSTPTWVTYALIDNEEFSGVTLEPACGSGAISTVFKKAGLDVISSDLLDRGYGLVGNDFTLYPHKPGQDEVMNVVTNPPVALAMEFVEAGLAVAKHKLALLLSLSFLETEERYKRIFSKTPPSRVWVFCDRVTFLSAYVKAQKDNSGTTAYAWFIWEKDRFGRLPMHTELRWITPGYKKQFMISR